MATMPKGLMSALQRGEGTSEDESGSESKDLTDLEAKVGDIEQRLSKLEQFANQMVQQGSQQGGPPQQQGIGA